MGIFTRPKSEEIGWLVLSIYTRSKIIFYGSFHFQYYSYNKPKSHILLTCNSLDDFDFNFYDKSKLWHLCLIVHLNIDFKIFLLYSKLLFISLYIIIVVILFIVKLNLDNMQLFIHFIAFVDISK